MKYRIEIKPLSANDAWKGKRMKTDNYISYEKELWHMLPNDIKIDNVKLRVYYEFGLSNKGADGDNCIKQFQDIIAKKYKFNDNKIYEWLVRKVDVEKGKEYVSFMIEKI